MDRTAKNVRRSFEKLRVGSDADAKEGRGRDQRQGIDRGADWINQAAGYVSKNQSYVEGKKKVKNKHHEGET